MKDFSFHHEAEEEFGQAISYFDDCAENLGLDFATEVYQTVERILAHPYAWTEIEKEIRRCLVSRFPYGVLYSIEPEQVFILAVMHLQKEPNYWKKRV